MKVSLPKFFKTGQFGQIDFGMSPADVEALCGRHPLPDPVSRRDKRTGGLIYGDIEFYFNEERLAMVFSDWSQDVPTGQFELTIEPGWVKRELTLEQVKKHLKKMGVIFQEEEDTANEKSVDLLLQSGVQLKIQTEEVEFSPEVGLWCFSHSKALPPLNVQIGLSIPIDSHELIKDIARREHESVSRICRRWLVERCDQIRKDPDNRGHHHGKAAR